jgi:cation diffusion facilitator family transporter
MFAINAGLFANFLLAVLKTTTGILGNSSALLADGINSTADVAYGIVISVMVKLSGKPADDEHPYGHQQMESVAAVVVGAFVMTTAIGIFWKSVDTTYRLWVDGGSTGSSHIALYVAMGTIILKLFLSMWTRSVGDKTGNNAVLALAADHKNDVFASFAATVGIYFGQRGYHFVDPLAGAVVALIILHTGVDIIRSSADDLMDTVPGKELGLEIRELIAQIKEVKIVEEVSAHRFGPWMVVTLTIGVDGKLCIFDGDEIATSVENLLIDNIEYIQRVYVHYHPHEPKASAHTSLKPSESFLPELFSK